MTENAKPTETLSESTWNAIVSLLSPAYPDITKERIQRLLSDEEESLDYVGTKDACRILNCNPTTLWRLEKSGRLQARRPFPGKRLFALKDIRKFLEN